MIKSLTNRVQLLIMNTVYIVNNSIKSVIKKEKEDSRTQEYLSWFTQQNGLRPIPHT